MQKWHRPPPEDKEDCVDEFWELGKHKHVHVGWHNVVVVLGVCLPELRAVTKKLRLQKKQQKQPNALSFMGAVGRIGACGLVCCLPCTKGRVHSKYCSSSRAREIEREKCSHAVAKKSGCARVSSQQSVHA